MIHAVTPNPTLDLGGIVERLVPNEKTYIHDESRHAGGNAINAARIIHRFRVPVTVTGFLGGGIGNEVQALLEKEGLKTGFVSIRESTRVNITVSENRTKLQTRLSFPGPRISSMERDVLTKQLGRLRHPSLLLVGGSFPPGVDCSYIARIIRSAQAKDIPTFLDVPGGCLRQLMDTNPLLIKPNLLEFQELIGRRVTSLNAIVKEAQKLTRHVPLVCVSSVGSGALLATPQGTWLGKMPRLNARTCVGAGDSMVGAMAAYAWSSRARIFSSQSREASSEETFSELLRYGLAYAAATLIAEPMALGTLPAFRRFLPKIKVERIDA